LTRRKKKATKEQIAAALSASAGNVALAARSLGVGRSTLFHRIKASASLREIVEDERESLVDYAESRLKTKVLEGDMTAIIWTLKASPAAKKRGWGERHEVTDGDGKPTPIAVLRMPIDEL